MIPNIAILHSYGPDCIKEATFDIPETEELR